MPLGCSSVLSFQFPPTNTSSIFIFYYFTVLSPLSSTLSFCLSFSLSAHCPLPLDLSSSFIQFTLQFRFAISMSHMNPFSKTKTTYKFKTISLFCLPFRLSVIFFFISTWSWVACEGQCPEIRMSHRANPLPASRHNANRSSIHIPWEHCKCVCASVWLCVVPLSKRHLIKKSCSPETDNKLSAEWVSGRVYVCYCFEELKSILMPVSDLLQYLLVQCWMLRASGSRV